ncbi:hypothetical protein E3N88_35422 [Mikania micrantha]|uniref:non-specific serine/threonine protein kinase n=1 Tax=Mikania micrantha TaxID=192012 RepID=A0A5N6M1A8_9ASTR|nr:hypothetical protein E3N88_35422 [Mikania micrantha]
MVAFVLLFQGPSPTSGEYSIFPTFPHLCSSFRKLHFSLDPDYSTPAFPIKLHLFPHTHVILHLTILDPFFECFLDQSNITGILCTLTCYLTSRKKVKVKVKVTRGRDRVPIPAVSKEIKEVRVEQVSTGDFAPRDGILLTIHDKNSDKDSDKVLVHLGMSKLKNGDNASSQGSFHHMDRDIYCESGEDGSSGNFHLYKPSSSSSHPISAPSPLVGLPEFSHLGWGHWFTLRDLELATNRFSKDNVIGEGGYGVVYRGTLVNRNPVAVKKLLNNPGYPHPSRRHLPTVSAHRLLQISTHLLFSMATESTLESPVITSIPITTPSLTIVHFPSSLKLLSNNYLGWKTQVEAILHGLDLFKFIDGSHPPPLPTTDETGRSTPHSDFQAWFSQDRLLFGALVGNLSPPIVPLITNATSSLDAWKILSNTYASPSRGHIKQLQHRLKQSSKNPTQSVIEYMQSVKTLVDELSILCKQMDTEDITDIILNGLDQSSYKPFISAIHARDNPISFHELHEKLINHELSLAQSTPLTPPIHHPTTAFLTHSKQHPKPWQPRPSNNSFHRQPDRGTVVQGTGGTARLLSCNKQLVLGFGPTVHKAAVLPAVTWLSAVTLVAVYGDKQQQQLLLLELGSAVVQGQAEKEFRVEVEAIGHVRHKNLVRLLGYCIEGTHRMLVYEYVNNGNLEQWLHGAMRQHGYLTWEARMKVLLGTAKALAYLHEAIEPKVVHRDIKSSNILIDDEFNAKVSDFGLAKLLGAGKSHITTRVMGTFGYVAPEYANTGLLNEKSDVYSFGVVLLESITGRDPVDYGRPSQEVNLVDWLKMMVGSRRSEEVVDPTIETRPSTRALKRALLTALRCVDPDSDKRPKMSNVVRMLESEEYPLPREDRRRRSQASSMEIESQRENYDTDKSDTPDQHSNSKRHFKH